MNDLLAFGIHQWREGAGRRGAQRRYSQESAAAHDESENLAGMRTVVWRGTTQPVALKWMQKTTYAAWRTWETRVKELG